MVALPMVGCASVDGGGWRDSSEAAAENDPLEGFNRQIFAANLAIDTFLLRPAAVAYREVVPDFGKDVVRNFLNHLRSPLILINDLAQGEGERAQTTFSRMLVNTVLGLGGLFDPASTLGLAYHNEDVGQTLATYGVGEGPYLVLPIIGPSNFRDAAGAAIGWLVDPVRIGVDAAGADEALYARAAAEGIDTRYRLMPAYDELRRTSLDFYAFTRSAYRQRREREIRNAGDGLGPLAELPRNLADASAGQGPAGQLSAGQASDAWAGDLPPAASDAARPAAAPVEPEPVVPTTGVTVPLAEPRYIAPRSQPADVVGETVLAALPLSDSPTAASEAGQKDASAIDPAVTGVTASDGAAGHDRRVSEAVPAGPVSPEPKGAPLDVPQVEVAAIGAAGAVDRPELVQAGSGSEVNSLAESAFLAHQAALRSYEEAKRSAAAASRSEPVER
ncbi:MAG: MlaA family lipoprotein [Alphaproteobacteria bacterium]